MCAWRFPEAINFCFLSAWVFSPGFWLAVINTTGLSTPTGSSDVTGMLCVRVGWGAWTACSSLSFILLFYPVYSARAVKLPYSGFCFIDMDVVFSHWCVFPLEIFVSSWCPDGQPLRRSVLSMYICIFVFATRFRARWHFSHSLDLILWHLHWKGTNVYSLSPCFHMRKKTTGSENEQVITETKRKQGFEILVFWMDDGNVAVTSVLWCHTGLWMPGSLLR